MLTMGYDDLRAQVGAAYAAGTLATGTPIAPDTVRKLACDAAIISVVVGNSGEILNQGREKRLFTWAQLKNLWARDHHCTFPGCNAPAAWTDAHHLIHWADGGRTDLCNAALLCGRHHTIVHRDRLAGTVTPDGVVWDLRPGSYRPPDPAERRSARDRPARHPAVPDQAEQPNNGHARSPAEKQSAARRSRSANRRAEPGDVRAGRKPNQTPLGHPPMRGRTHHQPGTNITGIRRPHMAPSGITHQPGTNVTGIRRPQGLTGINDPRVHRDQWQQPGSDVQRAPVDQPGSKLAHRSQQTQPGGPYRRVVRHHHDLVEEVVDRAGQLAGRRHEPGDGVCAVPSSSQSPANTRDRLVQRQFGRLGQNGRIVGTGHVRRDDPTAALQSGGQRGEVRIARQPLRSASAASAAAGTSASGNTACTRENSVPASSSACS